MDRKRGNKRLSVRLREIINEKFDGDYQNYALKAGVPPQRLQNYLDRNGMPSFGIAFRLAAAAEVNVEWLINAIGPKDKIKPERREKREIFTEEERTLLMRFRSVDAEARKTTLGYLDERSRK